MQTKTTVRYHYTSTRMTETRSQTMLSAGEDWEQKELFYIAGVNAEWCGHHGKQLSSSSCR